MLASFGPGTRWYLTRCPLHVHVPSNTPSRTSFSSARGAGDVGAALGTRIERVRAAFLVQRVVHIVLSISSVDVVARGPPFVLPCFPQDLSPRDLDHRSRSFGLPIDTSADPYVSAEVSIMDRDLRGDLDGKATSSDSPWWRDTRDRHGSTSITSFRSTKRARLQQRKKDTGGSEAS